MAKFEDDNIGGRTVFKGKLEEPCIICKDKTKYIDYCCECRICSTECYEELTKIISK